MNSLPTESRSPFRKYLPWLALTAVVLGLGFMLMSPTFKAWLDDVTYWAKDLIEQQPVVGALVFFVLAAVSAMLTFTSSIVLVPSANLVWGKTFTFFLMWGGWLAGAAGAYYLAALSHPIVKRLGYERKVAEYRDLATRKLNFWAIVLLCLALQSEIPSYLFGGIRYPFVRFMGAIAISEGVFALAIVYAGESLVEAKPIAMWLTLAALLAIAMIATYALKRMRHRDKTIRSTTADDSHAPD